MILALDLSSAVGWAAGRRGELPRFGVWPLPRYREGPGAQMAALSDALADAIGVYSPTLVAVEATLDLQGQTQHDTCMQQFGLDAVVHLVCYRRSIEVRQEKPDKIRAKLMGGSRQTKERIVRWARTSLGVDVTDHNAADALALWKFAVLEFVPVGQKRARALL